MSKPWFDKTSGTFWTAVAKRRRPKGKAQDVLWSIPTGQSSTIRFLKPRVLFLWVAVREGFIQETVDEICSLVNEPKGRLYINLPMSFGILHVAPLMNEFLQRYPGIQLELQFEDRRVEVIDPGFDMSIRIADMEDSSLAARKIAPCHHMVVAAPAYLQRQGKPEKIEELPNKHVIISNRLQDSALEWQFENQQREMSSVRVNAEIIANNSLAIKAMLLDGAGIARVPAFVMSDEVRSGALVNLFPDLITNRKDIYAVFPRREYMPNKTRVFIDFLVEKLPLRIG